MSTKYPEALKELIERSTVTIPELASAEIINVCDWAFENCKSLTTIDLPNATSIGGRAFGDCTSLTTVNLPSVTSIGNNPFGDCTSLTTVNLPSVTSISDNLLFQNCSKLTAIHFSAANKSTIEASSGYSGKWGATKATIYFDL